MCTEVYRGICRCAQRYTDGYAGVHRGIQRDMQVCTEVYRGICRCAQRYTVGYAGVHRGIQRDMQVCTEVYNTGDIYIVD